MNVLGAVKLRMHAVGKDIHGNRVHILPNVVCIRAAPLLEFMDICGVFLKG